MTYHSARSDVGKRRKHNEDRFHIDEKAGLYLLADGMGGQSAGEIAAELAVSTVSEFFLLTGKTSELTWPFGYQVQAPFEHNVLRTAIELANLKVAQVSEESDLYSGMGSTLVVAWIREGRLILSHVGDSRLYLFRDQTLEQITEDHSLVQEQLKLGIISEEEARNHRLRNLVTQAIGQRERVSVDILERELVRGDLILLTTDGLTDRLDDPSLSRMLEDHGDLEGLSDALVAAANEAGGDDNITLILVQYEP